MKEFSNITNVSPMRLKLTHVLNLVKHAFNRFHHKSCLQICCRLKLAQMKAYNTVEQGFTMMFVTRVGLLRNFLTGVTARTLGITSKNL